MSAGNEGADGSTSGSSSESESVLECVNEGTWEARGVGGLSGCTADIKGLAGVSCGLLKVGGGGGGIALRSRSSFVLTAGGGINLGSAVPL